MPWPYCTSLLLFTLTWPVALEPTHAGEAGTTGVNRLRVITYNVQFLPEPASFQNARPKPEYRARRIAQEVSRYDIVALQETFHAGIRKQIVSQVRTAWNGNFDHLASPTPAGFFTSGGCLLMSQLPMQEKSTTVFAHYSKPRDYGLRADGFAAKGVIHARITRGKGKPNSTIDVYVTHLEARADKLRPKQYAELAEFIRKTSQPDRPFLLLGDLNTKGRSENQRNPNSQYALLFRQLRAARPDGEVVDVWPRLMDSALGGTTEQESDTIGKRIDYIILGNPKPPHLRLTPVAITVKLFRDPKVVALSDHNAVAATFAWP